MFLEISDNLRISSKVLLLIAKVKKKIRNKKILLKVKRKNI